MNLKKRGLGRGLEALLAEEAVQGQPLPGKDAPSTTVEQMAMVAAFFKGIQKEHQTLLEEAESLKQLIEEFERLVKQE